MSIQRYIETTAPFAEHDRDAILWQRGRWPMHWLTLPTAAPASAAYRIAIELDQAQTLCLRLSAVERYRLWLDGAEAGVGPERGDERAWRMDAWELNLSPGRHWLAVQVWALGAKAPPWQVPLPPGLLVIAEGDWHERLSTGHGPWQVRALEGHQWMDQPRGFFTGPRLLLDGRVQPWEWQSGAGEGFAPAAHGAHPNAVRHSSGYQLPALVPATLPWPSLALLPAGRVVLVDALSADDPLADSPIADPAADLAAEHSAWQALLNGQGTLTIPARSARRCLVDLGEYRCAWPALRAAGAGGTIKLHFAEGLYDKDTCTFARDNDKGDRRRWEGRYLRGVGPAFICDGEERSYRSLEWECGRWLEIHATAADQALTLHALALHDTSHPLGDEGTLTSSDSRLSDLRELCLRTMRVGIHDHYCDCPYYERLQYIGDTRLEILTTWMLTSDDRLPQRALDDYADARLAYGMVPARHPARGTQIIPPFALWWIGMLHDRALWRDDPLRVRRLLPTARGIIDAWLAFSNADGLVEAPQGWNFIDWVTTHGWDRGMHAGADRGLSSILNWHFAIALGELADLETWYGEPELAQLQQRRRKQLMGALDSCFDPVRGRYRDTPSGDSASEHAQILALLAGIDGERRERVASSLCSDDDLARTTIYFSHYLFEAYYALGRGDLLWQRLGLWFDLGARGLTTTPEQPEPTRSDCHPWGTHPLYHITASMAGIRPTTAGFSTLRISPLTTIPLQQLALSIPHPRGTLSVNLQRKGATWCGTISAPSGITIIADQGISIE